MPRNSLFSDETIVRELKILLPSDKLDALRIVARQHGLAVTDYVRSLLFTHLARIAKDGGKS